MGNSNTTTQHAAELQWSRLGSETVWKTDPDNSNINFLKKQGFFFYTVCLNTDLNQQPSLHCIFPRKRGKFLQLLMRSTNPAMYMASLTVLIFSFSRTKYSSLWRDQQLGSILDIQIPNDPRVVFPNLLAVPNFMPKVAGICLTFWTFVINILT